MRTGRALTGVVRRIFGSQGENTTKAALRAAFAIVEIRSHSTSRGPLQPFREAERPLGNMTQFETRFINRKKDYRKLQPDHIFALCPSQLHPRIIRKNVPWKGNWPEELPLRQLPLGAQGSAVIYSLIETAKENGLNPYRYLLHLFMEAPAQARIDENWILKLLPICTTA